MRWAGHVERIGGGGEREIRIHAQFW